METKIFPFILRNMKCVNDIQLAGKQEQIFNSDGRPPQPWSIVIPISNEGKQNNTIVIPLIACLLTLPNIHNWEEQVHSTSLKHGLKILYKLDSKRDVIMLIQSIIIHHFANNSIILISFSHINHFSKVIMFKLVSSIVCNISSNSFSQDPITC